jgi:hypothetical protein
VNTRSSCTHAQHWKRAGTAALAQRTIDGYKAKARRLMQMARTMGGVEIDGLIACAKKTKSASWKVICAWRNRRRRCRPPAPSVYG